MIVIIQARLGSKRLPKKILMPIGGIPVVTRVCNAAQLADVGPVILAIPRGDDIAVNGIPVYEGSENDVAERFWTILKETSEPNFVRLCADSPFMDYITIRNAVRVFDEENAILVEGGCSGRNVQVVDTAAWLECLPVMTDAEREHVIPTWMKPRIQATLTVDTLKDYRRLRDL